MDSSPRKTHRFWNKKPVPQSEADLGTDIGPIDVPEPSEIRTIPLKLPADFEWCEMDISNPEQMKELYELLCENYVEDASSVFRFAYSKEFLKWALHPPGWSQELLVGVRVKSSNKLVAFISGIPVAMNTHTISSEMVEINFICVHKALRLKRLAPVLIKEITRRVNLKGVFQAIYTAGIHLPTPFTTCRYFHRSLNPQKLVDLQFSPRPQPPMTMNRLTKLNRLPEKPPLDGLRKMEKADLPQVCVLLNKYLTSRSIAPKLSDNEWEHWLLPTKAKENVVHSYVAVDDSGKITDFLSFYTLSTTVVSRPGEEIRAAYYFYSVPKDPESSKSWYLLMMSALVLALESKHDVFNCLDMLDNSRFITSLLFQPGDGLLHFYFYNWKCPATTPNQVGLIML